MELNSLSSRRRDFFLSHAPANLGDVQKKDLRASSLDSPELFCEEALKRSFEEASKKTEQKDQKSMSSNIANMGRRMTAAFNASQKKTPQYSGSYRGGRGSYQDRRGAYRGRGYGYNKYGQDYKKKEDRKEDEKDKEKEKDKRPYYNYDYKKKQQNFRK